MEDKYFHVKLGAKTIICGYENLFGKRAEFYYMSLMHVDAYGMRKCKLRPILDEEPEFNKQISQYTLEFYHKIVRTPMLEFKEKLYQKWANKNKKGMEAMVNEVQ